jgi:putative transposase
MKGWDYGSEASYFVTILTHGKNNYFGIIRDGRVYYSEIGEAACKCWTEIPDHFPFVKLGAWVVMPDHVHGIIHITQTSGKELSTSSKNEIQNLTDPTQGI